MSNTALSDELHSNLHNTPTLHNSERICALLELKQKKKKKKKYLLYSNSTPEVRSKLHGRVSRQNRKRQNKETVVCLGLKNRVRDTATG